MQEPPKKNTRSSSPLKGFLPFFWMALACTGGIISANITNLALWVWFFGLVSCSITWILTQVLPKSWVFTHHLKKWTRSDLKLPGVILLAVFFLGGWRYKSSQPFISPNHVGYYRDRGIVEIIGTIVQPPDVRDVQTSLTLEVDSLKLEDEVIMPVPPEEISGKILVQVSAGFDWSYGDQIRVVGALQTPTDSGDFSYSAYLARKGIFGLIPYAWVDHLKSGTGNPVRSFLYRFRDMSYDILHQLYQSPESDLLAGILLGRDRGLSKDLQEAFRRTGTTHIIAISGFNIAILAGIFSSSFTKILGRKWGTLTALGVIAGYTILVGADAAVVRAAIMGSLGVFGGLFGRRQNGINSLGLASFVMMLINPNVLWDIGFQLSLAATLGLVLYGQPLEEKSIQWMSNWMSEERAQKWISPLSEFFLFTLAAQVMTLPIIAYHFGGISWLTFVANPLILPVQSLVMILGGLSLVFGVILPALGSFFAFLTYPSVRYTIRMVTWLGSWPGGDWIKPGFNFLCLVLFYGLLFGLTLFPKESQKKFVARLLSPQVGLLLLSSLVALVWHLVLTRPDDHLHLRLLDSSGTLLIQTPGGHAVLIGGGPSNAQLSQSLGELLPGSKQKIDVLIVGSATQDDLAGLTGTLSSIPVEMALWGVDTDKNQSTRAIYRHFLEVGTSLVPIEVGQCLNLSEEIRLRTLWADERGALLWLEWQNFSALLPTGKLEGEWLAAPSAPDVLLLPDGIAPEGLSLGRINLWSPRVILLPLKASDLPLVGENELMTVLSAYPVISTLDHDWVQITTDGENVWVTADG